MNKNGLIYKNTLHMNYEFIDFRQENKIRKSNDRILDSIMNNNEQCIV